MTGTDKHDRFTIESAQHALHLACAAVKLDPHDADLIRIGENAIYALHSQGIVVRVARDATRLARVERELAVARWLAHHQYPAVRVAEQVNQPVQADGRIVTFWELLDVSGDATLAQLGALLRDLHALPNPEFNLPAFDPFSAVPHRLADPGNADPQAVSFLTDLHQRLRNEYDALQFPSQFGLIHGDAHQGNVITTPSGPKLSDFEVVAWGPREWDLTTTAMTLDRFNLPRAEYNSYVEAYGRDVTEWDGYPTLLAARELTMVTWLMQLVDVSPQHAQEFTHRVKSLRDGDTRREWHAF